MSVPAPLYLRTLWRYTNAVIIIIINYYGIKKSTVHSLTPDMLLQL